MTYAHHQIHHLTHLNMQALFGFPLLLLGIFQLYEGPRIGAALLAAAGFAIQTLSCAYYGVAAAVLASIVGLCGLGRLHRRRAWGHAAAAASLAALACWPYVEAFRSASMMGWGTTGAGVGGIALGLPRDLIRTNAWLWSWVLPSRGDSAFAGFAVLALAVWGAFRGFASFHARVLVLVGSVFLLLSLGRQLEIAGVELSLPYAWLQDAVPILSAGRHPVSFVVVYLVALGMLAALGARLVGATRGPRRLALLLSIVVLEVLAPTPRRERRPELPAVYAAVSRLQPPGAIVELPFDSPSQQLWASVHGLQTASGYLPHAPPEWLTLAQWFHEDLKATPPRDVSDRRSLIYLRARFPVRYLIAHPQTDPAWLRNIDATPSVFRRVLEVDGARVYRISRSGRGRRLRRDYRSEDVVHGLELRIRGPSGHALVVYDGGAECARLALAPEPRTVHLPLAPRPARTLVSLEMGPEPEAEFELMWIEPTPGG